MGQARFFGAPALALAAVVATLPALSQEVAANASLVLELNAAQPSEKGCRLTFVVSDNLGRDLAKVAFEMAMFNAAGVVDRLTVLDFKDLPAGKTKVARFRTGRHGRRRDYQTADQYGHGMRRRRDRTGSLPA
jgi:hypothetical protein